MKKNFDTMTTIEKIENGIITLAEFTEDQQSFIRGLVKLSFNEGLEQVLRIHDVVGRSEPLPILDRCECEEPNEEAIKVCMNCNGYVE